MPSDSSWNTPSVSPTVEHRVSRASPSGRSSRSGGSPPARLDVLERAIEDRQGAQPQVVHLQEAELLELLPGHWVDDVLAVLAERDVLDDGAVGDHDAGGVRRDVARHALELDREARTAREAPGVLAPSRAFRSGSSSRAPSRQRRGAGAGGDLLRDAVDVLEGHVQHATDVAHDRARGHRPEGDDLGHVLASRSARACTAGRARAPPCRSRCRCPASRCARCSGSARRAGRTAAGRRRVISSA